MRRRPVALGLGHGAGADMNETCEALAIDKAERCVESLVKGDPFRQPLCIETMGIGGDEKVHAGSAGRKLLFPARYLRMVDSAAGNGNHHRHTGETRALDLALFLTKTGIKFDCSRFDQGAKAVCCCRRIADEAPWCDLAMVRHARGNCDHVGNCCIIRSRTAHRFGGNRTPCAHEFQNGLVLRMCIVHDEFPVPLRLRQPFRCR